MHEDLRAHKSAFAKILSGALFLAPLSDRGQDSTPISGAKPLDNGPVAALTASKPTLISPALQPEVDRRAYVTLLTSEISRTPERYLLLKSINSYLEAKRVGESSPASSVNQSLLRTKLSDISAVDRVLKYLHAPASADQDIVLSDFIIRSATGVAKAGVSYVLKTVGEGLASTGGEVILSGIDSGLTQDLDLTYLLNSAKKDRDLDKARTLKLFQNAAWREAPIVIDSLMAHRYNTELQSLFKIHLPDLPAPGADIQSDPAFKFKAAKYIEEAQNSVALEQVTRDISQLNSEFKKIKGGPERERVKEQLSDKYSELLASVEKNAGLNHFVGSLLRYHRQLASVGNDLDHLTPSQMARLEALMQTTKAKFEIELGEVRAKAASTPLEKGLTPQEFQSAVRTIENSSKALGLAVDLIGLKDPDLANSLSIAGGVAISVATGVLEMYANPVGGILTIGTGICNAIFGDSGAKRHKEIMRTLNLMRQEIHNIHKELHQTRVEMHQRFDRVENILISMDEMIRAGFDNVLTSLEVLRGFETISHQRTQDRLDELQELVEFYGENIQNAVKEYQADKFLDAVRLISRLRPEIDGRRIDITDREVEDAILTFTKHAVHGCKNSLLSGSQLNNKHIESEKLAKLFNRSLALQYGALPKLFESVNTFFKTNSITLPKDLANPEEYVAAVHAYLYTRGKFPGYQDPNIRDIEEMLAVGRDLIAAEEILQSGIYYKRAQRMYIDSMVKLSRACIDVLAADNVPAPVLDVGHQIIDKILIDENPLQVTSKLAKGLTWMVPGKNHYGMVTSDDKAFVPVFKSSSWGNNIDNLGYIWRSYDLALEPRNPTSGIDSRSDEIEDKVAKIEANFRIRLQTDPAIREAFRDLSLASYVCQLNERFAFGDLFEPIWLPRGEEVHEMLAKDKFNRLIVRQSGDVSIRPLSLATTVARYAATINQKLPFDDIAIEQLIYNSQGSSNGVLAKICSERNQQIVEGTVVFRYHSDPAVDVALQKLGNIVRNKGDISSFMKNEMPSTYTRALEFMNGRHPSISEAVRSDSQVQEWRNRRTDVYGVRQAVELLEQLYELDKTKVDLRATGASK